MTNKKFKEDEFNQLVPILSEKIGDNKVNTINARDLWKYLEVKTKFNDWIKARIRTCGLVEGTDFVNDPKKKFIENTNLTRIIHEYHVTFDAAKFISLSEHTKIGQRVREYFVRIESRYKKLISEKSDEWSNARLEGKVIRKKFSDTIKILQQYAKEQGSTGFKHFFVNYTKLINRNLFGCPSITKIKKNLRDCVDVEQIFLLATLEKIVTKHLLKGIEHGDRYKEIYQDIKKIVESYITMTGMSYPSLLTDDELRLVIERKYTTKQLTSD